MYYLADFSKLNEPEKEKRSPGRFIAPTLALAGGGYAGAYLTDDYINLRRQKLYGKADNNSARSDKLLRVLKEKRHSLSDDAYEKITNRMNKNSKLNDDIFTKVRTINKNNTRNNIIGGIAGAALGYGAYRGIKAGINKLRNKKEK